MVREISHGFFSAPELGCAAPESMRCPRVGGCPNPKPILPFCPFLSHVWCGVVWCGVVWCVVWCGVVWCGVVWCGVVWCAEGAVTKRQKAGMSTHG